MAVTPEELSTEFGQLLKGANFTEALSLLKSDLHVQYIYNKARQISGILRTENGDIFAEDEQLMKFFVLGVLFGAYTDRLP